MEDGLRFFGNNVLLKLQGKPEKKIAELRGRWLFVVRDPQKSQVMRKYESIGMNNELLKSNRFDYIRVYYGNKVLETTRWFFHDRGLFFHFKQSGNEKQKFLDLSLFGLERALRWEREKERENERNKKPMIRLNSQHVENLQLFRGV